jgi:hypothetical protein
LPLVEVGASGVELVLESMAGARQFFVGRSGQLPASVRHRSLNRLIGETFHIHEELLDMVIGDHCCGIESRRVLFE